ncbi:FtsQ-type POTRA domain-containing protein [bacterium]|nr:FtsQ-type POTRA domain-containing protein [bacterium]
MKDLNINKLGQAQSTPNVEKTRPFFSVKALVKGIITLSTLSITCYCLVKIPPYFSRPIDPTKISTSGNKILTPDMLLKQMDLKTLTPWIDIDPYELSLKLIEHPWINEALVHRKINLGLSIIVKEQEPIAYLKTVNDLFLIGKNNRVLSKVKSREKWNLPIIVDNGMKSINPGEFLPSDQLKKVNALMDLLKTSKILPVSTVSEIDITDPLNIVLITVPYAIPIKMGSSNFRQKLQNLKYALPSLIAENRNIRFIDLRYTSAVVFRRKI